MFKKLNGKVVAVTSGAALLAGQAHATLPTEITDAIASAKTDGLVIAGGFLLAIIVISAMLLAKRGVTG